MFYPRLSKFGQTGASRCGYAATGESLGVDRHHLAAPCLSALPQAIGQVQSCLGLDQPIIKAETEWRMMPAPDACVEQPAVQLSRWRSFDETERDAHAENPADSHMVKIVLRTTNLSLRINGRSVHDGLATPGMVHVAEPGSSARCVFRGPYDTLHLRISDALITECLEGRPSAERPILAARGGLVHDHTIERLARTLVEASHNIGVHGALFVEYIGMAIVAKLLSRPRLHADDSRTPRAGLPTWRLKRSLDYIEVGIGKPVRLSDMAKAVGLTPAHFAAQFKASTGFSPHEYLLRRRIERAQEMLRDAELSLVDIALSVGFNTQSHFTTTFTRLVGQTPRAWRLAHWAS